MAPLIGCIADDFTGASDVASSLRAGGVRTLVSFKATRPDNLKDYGAVVFALKSRSIEVKDAIAQSLKALAVCRNIGAARIYFKYCSTFDSTRKGNIGPVIDALLTEMNEKVTIVCPSFPDNERTVYQGYLFVKDRLLSETHMRHHPLNPMSESNLIKWLEYQSESDIEHLPLSVVEEGASAIKKKIAQNVGPQRKIFVVDAINESHLREIAAAADGMALVTGGSALSEYLPQAYRANGLLENEGAAIEFASPLGRTICLSGSCSEMTLNQLENAPSSFPKFQLTPELCVSFDSAVDKAMVWLAKQDETSTPIIYSSANNESLRHSKSVLGDRSSAVFEKILAEIALRSRALGFTKFIVAGGETSGAILTALDVSAVEIGPSVAQGVPITCTSDGEEAFIMKSGNFGGERFFEEAKDALG
ncbi:MAG: 3-oxo-tetronate kinase [Pseudomonadota bacterium]